MLLKDVQIPKGTYIGLDLASKTGYAVVTSDGQSAILAGYGSISIPTGLPEIEKLEHVEAMLNPILRDWIVPEKSVGRKTTITIEHSYLKRIKTPQGWVYNAKTFQLLSQLGAWVIRSIRESYKDDTIIHLIYPSEARKMAGVKGTASKQQIVNFINSKLPEAILDIRHNDIADAVVLAIAGGIENARLAAPSDAK